MSECVQIKTFVVLSTPSSTSSLLAEAMHSKIDMRPQTTDSPTGIDSHYENQELLNLNRKIMAAAYKIDDNPLFKNYDPFNIKDPWDNPPSYEAVCKVRDKFAGEIGQIVRNLNAQASKSKQIPNVHGYSGNPCRYVGMERR